MVSHLLADFGADVIKIERPGVGNDLRNWRQDGVEIFWKAYRAQQTQRLLGPQERHG